MQQYVAITGLFTPVYEVKKSLKYDITPDNATSIKLPEKFGQIIILIEESTCDGVWIETYRYLK